ncbi:ribosome biogenesis protein NOP53-like [Cornus florida]|uniref:ribosome biogenesis protein NOP53-like n=1 Tax=Cornus florida TaxID=4283 RepID=UPI0028A155A4|nr:ribosome biogenesis protein NOP53-like [Cornus florida]
MGKKAKSSRKGKKAWRANISTEDIDDYFEKSTKDALSGGSLTHLPSDDLFYLDKSRDLSVKRKIEKHREKILRCDSVLQRNSFVEAVPSSSQRKSHKKRKEVQKAKDAVQDCSEDDGVLDSGMADIWDDKGEDNDKIKKKFKPSIIPAVEVEPPGCSFNPSFESHQDSLACAVADEMQKIYRNELGPQPVPLTVPGEVIDEEDMYFLEADGGSDNDDPHVEKLEENGDTESEKRTYTTKRVTRVKQNKRARRKEQIRTEAEAKQVEELSKEIDCLPDIIQEIAREDEEKQRKHLRRIVAKQEGLKSRPPRLGKHKFEPAPRQVLLSEEITGSLRKLKGCCTLARDRYKSLEKRGLIVPTAKSGRK